jgi:hypothetical protein
MTNHKARIERSSREPGPVVGLPSAAVAVRPAVDDVDVADALPAVAVGAQSLDRAAA